VRLHTAVNMSLMTCVLDNSGVIIFEKLDNRILDTVSLLVSNRIFHLKFQD